MVQGTGEESGETEAGREIRVTVGGAVAVVFLAVMVVLILRGIRGHRKSGESDEEPDINAAVEPKSTLAIELAKHKRVEKPCGAEQS